MGKITKKKSGHLISAARETKSTMRMKTTGAFHLVARETKRIMGKINKRIGPSRLCCTGNR